MGRFRWAFFLPVAVVILQSCGERMGNLQGKVLLSDREDHKDTLVYLWDTDFSTFTDRMGRFSLSGIPPGEYTLVATRLDYQGGKRPVVVKKGEMSTVDTITLELEVKAEPPKPVEGFGKIQGGVVLADGLPPTGTIIVVGETRISVTVESDGKFELDGIPSGDHNLLAVKSGYRPSNTLVSVVPDQTVTVGMFALEPLEDLRTNTGIDGTVVIDGNRSPAGVMVMLEGTSLMQITDGSGRFSFKGLDQGAYSLSFQKVGYKENRVVGISVVRGRMTPVETSMKFATFDGSEPEYMLEPGVLTGVVLTEIPEDRAGTAVWLTPGEQSVETDAEGHYSFENVRPGTYVVSANRQFYHPADVVNVIVRPGEVTQVGGISLKAVGPEDFADAPSSLSGIALLEGEIRHTGILVALAGTPLSTVTTYDGSFVFDDLPPGDYTLLATREGFLPAERKIAIPANRDVLVPPIELFRVIIAPKIVSVSPVDGTRDVPVDDFVEIVIQFDQKMNGKLLKESFQIRPKVDYVAYYGGEGVAAYSRSMQLRTAPNMADEATIRNEVPPSGDDKLVVRLSRYGRPPVALGTEYTVLITQKAVNVEGVPIEEPYRFSFTTGKARITRSWPEDNADNIYFTGENGALLFDFNDKIDVRSFEKAFSILPKTTSIPDFSQIKVPSGDRIRVEVQLEDDTRYEVRVSGELRTIDGKPLDNTPYRFGFRTGNLDSLNTGDNSGHDFIGDVEMSPDRVRLLEKIRQRRQRE